MLKKILVLSALSSLALASQEATPKETVTPAYKHIVGKDAAETEKIHRLINQYLKPETRNESIAYNIQEHIVGTDPAATAKIQQLIMEYVGEHDDEHLELNGSNYVGSDIYTMSFSPNGKLLVGFDIDGNINSYFSFSPVYKRWMRIG